MMGDFINCCPELLGFFNLKFLIFETRQCVTAIHKVKRGSVEIFVSELWSGTIFSQGVENTARHSLSIYMCP